MGRINDPTSAACITGPCGETMELYLVIARDQIERVMYYTDGCEATKACGAMVARLSEGKTVREALMISAGDVVDLLNDLSEEHVHCSILAVSTLYRAIADFLLKP